MGGGVVVPPVCRPDGARLFGFCPEGWVRRRELAAPVSVLDTEGVGSLLLSVAAWMAYFRSSAICLVFSLLALTKSCLGALLAVMKSFAFTFLANLFMLEM